MLFTFHGVTGLTWTITRDRVAHPGLWLFGSFAMITTLQAVRPVLATAALTPVLGFLLLAQPSLGLPLFLAYPSRRALIGCSVSCCSPWLCGHGGCCVGRMSDWRGRGENQRRS